MDDDDLAAGIGRAERLEDELRWQSALDAYDEARAAAAGSDAVLGEIESGRARALLELGRVDEAQEAERAAREHFEAAGEEAMAALSSAALAWRGGAPEELDDAITAAAAARQAIDRMTDDPAAPVAGARARQITARLLFAAGRIDEGESEYRAARDVFADIGDDRRLARCDAAMALDLLLAGRLEEAEARAEAAVAGLTMLDRDVEVAQLRLLLGRIEAQGERVDDARASFDAARAVFAERGLDAQLAEATHLKALVATMTGDDGAAVQLLGEAMEAARRAGAAQGEAASRLELGLALGRLGRFDEAEAVFTAAADALAAGGDRAGAARAVYGLATTRRDRGRPEEAVEAFEAAIAAFDVGGFVSAAAQTRLDGAGVLEHLGRVDDALAWLDQAAAGFRSDGEPVGVAMARRAWGAVAGHAGREEGYAAVAEARAVLAEHGAGWEVAECDAVMARSLAAAGRLDEAVTLGRSAVEGFAAVGDGVAATSSLILVGRIQAQAGQLDAADERLREAIAVAEQVSATPLAAEAHEALADVLDALDRTPEAVTHRRTAATLLA